MSSSIYDDLPEEPELAFVKVEDYFRAELNSELRELPDDSRYYTEAYISYMNKAAAAARELDLNILRDYDGNYLDRDVYDKYKAFLYEIDAFKVRVSILHGRRTKKYSIRIAPSIKESIREYISKIKTIIDGIDIPGVKREALHERINAFEIELERDRTRFEIAMDLIIEASDSMEEASEKLNPLRKFIDSITKLLKQARTVEKEQQKLPSPSEQKRLDPPSKSSQKQSDSGQPNYDLDDDIPF
ncbi:hypothetical protein [Methylorubrum sp. POS3]|uniref:hypothetical protein n=1 Tax=Methylorubrum sp. POS3 TaxID=2998492 RepID=UPI00372BCEFC